MADGLVTMPDGMPELTLGPEVVLWIGKYLRHANGVRAGERFQLTASQFKWLMWFYSVTPEGRWRFDRGARRWPKGAGKVRALGVRFGGPGLFALI